MVRGGSKAAMWENTSAIKVQFLEFNLGDKVVSTTVGIVRKENFERGMYIVGGNLEIKVIMRLVVWERDFLIKSIYSFPLGSVRGLSFWY